MSQITDIAENFAGRGGDGNCVSVTDGDGSQVLWGRIGMENLFRGDRWGLGMDRVCVVMDGDGFHYRAALYFVHGDTKTQRLRGEMCSSRLHVRVTIPCIFIDQLLLTAAQQILSFLQYFDAVGWVF